MDLRGRDDFNVTSNAVRQAVGTRCHINTVTWHNDDSAARFMQIFNALSANITVGTTTPDMVLQMAADSSETFDFGDQEYSTGFSYAITTTATGNSTGTSSWISISYR